MSDTWNLEIVADSKPEAPPEKPSETPPSSAVGNPIEDSGTSIPSVLSNDHSLGAIMTMAREARGLSRDQAAKASNIPAYYLTMIETDDYSSIADQLYLLPFLRRYAVFVALEPEEVASRFIREVQRADMNPGRSSEPIAMFEPRRPIPWRMIMTIAWAVVAVIGGWYAYRYYEAHKASILNAKVPAAEASAAPDSEQAAPQAEETSPTNLAAPIAMPSTAIVPEAAPSIAAAPAPAPSTAVAPPAVPHAAAPPAPPQKPLLKPSAHSSSHLHSPLKSASPARRLSMRN
jgi:cytoskeletal protein RodZ